MKNLIYILSFFIVGISFSQTPTRPQSRIPAAKVETVKPQSPPSGYKNLYPKADGQWYAQDDAGNEICISCIPDLSSLIPKSDIATDADVSAMTAGKVLDATRILNEDDFVSDSDVNVPSQRSAHRYVDRRDPYLSQLGTVRKGMQLRFRDGLTRTVSIDAGTFLDWDPVNHQSSPHNFDAQSILTFSYIMSDGTVPALSTALIADASNTTVFTNLEREENGAIVNVTTNREIAHRVYINSLTSDVKVLLAQHQWNTAAELLQKIQTEDIIIPTELASYQYVGAILVSQGSDNYQEGNNSGILMASEFGSIVGTGGTGTGIGSIYLSVSNDLERNALTNELIAGLVVGVTNSTEAGGGYAEYRVLSPAATYSASTVVRTYPEESNYKGAYTSLIDAMAANLDAEQGDYVIINKNNRYGLGNSTATSNFFGANIATFSGLYTSIEQFRAVVPNSGGTITFGVDNLNGTADYYTSTGTDPPTLNETNISISRVYPSATPSGSVTIVTTGENGTLAYYDGAQFKLEEGSLLKPWLPLTQYKAGEVIVQISSEFTPDIYLYQVNSDFTSIATWSLAEEQRVELTRIGTPPTSNLPISIISNFDSTDANYSNPLAHSPEVLDDIYGNGFTVTTSDNQILEANKTYQSNSHNLTYPTTANEGDFIRVRNKSSVLNGTTIILTGTFRTPITGTLIPAIGIAPSGDFNCVYTNGAWEFSTEILTSADIFDSKDGITLAPNVLWERQVASANALHKMPSVPAGVYYISLDSGSTDMLTIEQADMGAAPQFILENFTVARSFEIPLVNVGEFVTITTKSDTGQFKIKRPWIINASKEVFWHTDISGTAIASYVNLFPQGSSLTNHTPPVFIKGGSYSVAIGNSTTGSVTSEIKYISNKEGDAWIRQTEEQDTRILDNIEIGLRSAGTNSGSRVEIDLVDNDGVTYPSSSWVYDIYAEQYTGGSSIIDEQKKSYDGNIGLGRNKQGSANFYYIGDTPNGISDLIVRDFNGGTTLGVTVTYQGTNYNDSFTEESLLNSPLPWTTLQGQIEATDQAAYIVELTEYPEETIISFREPDNTDADYGKLFNWQVKAGQTILATEVNDNSNEAELIAIKPKLERFGIGTITPEGLLPDWQPLTEYKEGKRFVAPMPINADFISNNGAEVGLNYIFEAKTDIPNTITAFDDVQADSGNYDLIGIFKVNGTDVRVLNGSGTMGLDPLNSLSNSANNEFIKWTTTDTPQTIRLLSSPSFVTVWEDYTGENIVQPTAANEDFVLPANSNMQVTRVGNAIKVIFKSNEGGATGETFGTIASNEIGILKQVPNVKEDGTAMTNADYVAKGLLPLVNGYTLTDGATNNPKFALMYPTFVSGNDLAVPSTFSGYFVRNLGGNAAAFMVSQSDATAPNSLRLRTSSNAGGNVVNATHSMFTNTGNTTTQGTVQLTGDIETRPENFAMQFCLVLDSYSKVLIINTENLTITNPNEVDTTKVLQPNGDGTATFNPSSGAIGANFDFMFSGFTSGNPTATLNWGVALQAGYTLTISVSGTGGSANQRCTAQEGTRSSINCPITILDDVGTGSGNISWTVFGNKQ